MTIKQLSVFAENRVGALLDITSVLRDWEIDMRAFSVAETSDFGIVRLLVDKPEAAKKVLKDAGLTVVETAVIGVELNDRPGTFHDVLAALAAAGVSIEYTYAFARNSGSGKAYMILRPENTERALAALKGFNLLAPADVYAE